MSRAEFAKELVAYGSSFFRKFVISVLHHIFSRKLSPIIDDSTRTPDAARQNDFTFSAVWRIIR